MVQLGLEPALRGNGRAARADGNRTPTRHPRLLVGVKKLEVAAGKLRECATVVRESGFGWITCGREPALG